MFKKILSLFLSMCIISCFVNINLFVPSVCADETEQELTANEIPDGSLRRVLYKALNYGSLTPSNLARLETLDCSILRNEVWDWTDITTLKGLEYCTNLISLKLDRNQISDISALAGLINLTHLSLYNNKVSDISALEGLTGLTELDLSNNQISDISALEGLNNLTYLSLYNNKVSDISTLAGLTGLTALNLSTNQISDINVIAGLTGLSEMDLSTNRISDISALAGLTSLTNLCLCSNQISNINVLKKLENLKGLQLHYNHISDVTALEDLNNLTYLDLRGNRISDISSLSKLTKLDGFYWWNQKPVLYTFVSDSIDSLDLDVSGIKDREISILSIDKIQHFGSDGKNKQTHPTYDPVTKTIKLYNVENGDYVTYYFSNKSVEFTGDVRHNLIFSENPGNTSIPHYVVGDKNYVNLANGGITWLKEMNNSGKETWFGLKLPDNAIQNIDMSNKYFYVEWISPEEMLTHPEYANLDPAEKDKIQESRGKLFYAGIADEHGNKIDVEFSSDNPAKLYVKVGSNWETHDLQSVFITADKDQPVEVSYDETVKDPEGGEGYAVMNLTHFSPYFVYDAKDMNGDFKSNGRKNLGSMNKDFFITGDLKTKIIAWSSVGLILTAFGVLVFMKKYKKIK